VTRTSIRTSSTTSFRPTTTRSAPSGCCVRSSPTACIEGQRERGARANAEIEAPEAPVISEIEDIPSDELVAALAGGAALTFEPDVEEEEILLPGVRVVPAHPRDLEGEGAPRVHEAPVRPREEPIRPREDTPRAH